MTELEEVMMLLRGQHLGAVVHLGAGQPGVDLELLYQDSLRTVLVDGDESACIALEERSRGRPGAEVVHATIGPVGGFHVWYRYNLRKFDGLLDVRSLSVLFPRLFLLSRSEVQVEDLVSLLGQLAVVETPQRPNVLIIDLPALSEQLLKGLANDGLESFEWLVLRHGYRALCTATTASAEMDAQGTASLDDVAADSGYRLADPAHTERGPFAISLYRRDAALLQSNQATGDVPNHVATQEGPIPTRTAMHVAEHLQERMDLLVGENALLSSRVDELLALSAGIESRRDALEKTLCALAQQFGQQPDDLPNLSGGQPDCVRPNYADLPARIHELAQQRDAGLRLIRGNESAVAELQHRYDAVARALSREAQRAERAESQLQAVRERLLDIDLERSRAELQRSLVREELARAEAQIDLIKDIMLRETGP